MKITNIDALTREIELLDEDTSELLTVAVPELTDLTEFQLWDEFDVAEFAARVRDRGAK
jgi:hypothetical protein